jgi:hypothetical protein
MKKVILWSVVLPALLWLSASADSDLPKLINYQGVLTQSDGRTPVEDETYHLTFKLYGSDSGDDSLWWEHHKTVQVTGGLFNVILGSVAPLDLPFDAPYWLGITVGSDAELSPRIQLTSVGYAFRAQKADTASVAISSPVGGWTDESSVVRLTTNTDKVGMGTNAPKSKFQIGNWLTFHDGPYQFMGFNWGWWNSANRRINDGGAARMMFYEDDGTLIFQSKPFGAAGEELSPGATMFIRDWNRHWRPQI